MERGKVNVKTRRQNQFSRDEISMENVTSVVTMSTLKRGEKTVIEDAQKTIKIYSRFY